MKIHIQMLFEDDEDQLSEAMEIFSFQRETLCAENLGLSLIEAKECLTKLQQNIVHKQVTDYHQQASHCPNCQSLRSRKGWHSLKIRTLFGKLELQSPRFYHCACEEDSQSSFSPLAEILKERSSPELLYLQSKWAALLPYDLTVKLLGEVFPLNLSASSLKEQIRRLAERCESELGSEAFSFIEGCQRDWDKLPEPDGPMTVGLDGAYIHLRDEKERKAGSMEVIVGKVLPAEAQSKCLAFVHRYDEKPRRRLFECLKSQGFQLNQSLLFLSDGGETVRDLQFYLSPQSEHLLDWFHITMRLTVMQQFLKGLPEQLGQHESRSRMEQALESIKWFLWHGNLYHGLQCIGALVEDVEMLNQQFKLANIPKLLKAIHEFHSYIRSNQAFIPNYGDRYRYGEIITTSFVESAVNQVVSKRFVKKQQMRWTRQGVHLLLQVRTQVLNDEWRSTFTRWYPKLHLEKLENPNTSSVDAA